MSNSAFDHAVQAKVALIYQDPDCVAADNVNQNTISLVEPEGNGVVVTGTAQPALAVIVPGVQGPSGTAFEEIPLNKLAPGALPSGITVASANIVDGTIVNADINAAAGIVDTKLATISTAGKVSNSATTATANNTASAIVARDASGNFTANVITADLAGKSDSTDELENGLTFNNSGNGIASGTEFDGTVAATVSYNSVGAAAAGHSHANLIFVPAGANDAALAAAFADAVANDKKIVFSENTTVKIPTVAATIQAVCELVVPTVSVEILIESGHEIDNVNVLRDGDYSRFTISSEDAEVLVDSGWDPPAFVPPDLPGQLRGVVECYNATAPVWSIILDCNSVADHGLVLFHSKGYINALKGFRRSRVANIQVIEGSILTGGRANINNQLKGIISTDGLQRGIWVTFASSAACPNADLRNNGTDTNESNHVAIFVSRASHVQFDSCDCSGSTRGLRTARSVVSARGANWSNISGLVINAFDGNIVSLTDGNFNDCGSASPNWIMAIASSTIVANSCSFNNAGGIIANLQGPDSHLSLNDCTGTNIKSRIIFSSFGEAFCHNGSFSADAAAWNASDFEFFTGGQDGKISVFGGTYDGAGVVRNLGRGAANSALSLHSLTATSFTENIICQLSESAICYANGSTHNGSANVLQRGTNANGEFVRYADGTQECWAWLEVTTISNNKLMTRQWQFPAAFFSSGALVSVNATLSKRNSSNQSVASTQNKLKDCQVISGAHSQDVCNFDIEINSTATTEWATGNTLWIRAHAIGRWF